MTHKIIKDYENGDISAFFPFIFILAMISTFFTFAGFNLVADGPMQKVNAALFAVMCGVGIFLFWSLALEFVPRQKTPLTRTFAWILVSIGMAAIFCISSLTNMMAFRGLEAMEYDLRTEVTNMAVALDQRYQHGLTLGSLATDLRTDYNLIISYAEEEKQDGTFSGYRGPGAVYKSFISVSYSLENLVQETAEFSRQNETRYDAVSKTLADMRSVNLMDLPLKERTRRIEILADDAQRHLANMDPRNVAASIARAAKALPSEIDLRVTYSANKAVAKTQRLALERASEDIQAISDKLAGIAAEIATSEVVPLTRFESKSPAKAVVEHADNYFGFWVAALCADAIPVFIILFLSLYFYRKTEEDLAHERINNTTVEDMVRVRLAEEAARLGYLDRRSVSYYNKKAVGRLDNGGRK